MSQTPTLVNTRDFGYVSIPPKFDSEDFGSWKERMLLHIVGVEPYLLTILTQGPFVPQTVTYVPASTSDGDPIQTMETKAEAQWTDDERKLVNLDDRLRNMLVTTLPTDVMKTVIKLKSSKQIWDTLCIMFDGTEDLIATKKIDLKRAYENFFSLPNKKLEGIFTCFKGLLNDMTNVGISHNTFEVCHKFIDSLPQKWQGLRQILRTTQQIKTLDLESLYETL